MRYPQLARAWRWMMYALLFLLPLQTRLILRDTSPVGVVWEWGRLSVYATQLLVVIAVALHAYVMRRELRNAFFRIPFWLRIVILGAAVWNIAWSFDIALTLQWMTWFVGASYVGYVVARASLVPDNGFHLYWKWVMAAVLAACVLQASLGLHQVMTGSITGSSWLGMSDQVAARAGTSVVQALQSDGELTRVLRAHGSLFHPVALGWWLCIGLVMLLLVHKRVYADSKWIAGTYLSVLAILGIVMTFARSIWLGIFMGCIALSILIKQQRWNVARILLTLGMLLVAAFPITISRFGIRELPLDIRSHDERINGISAQSLSTISNQHIFVGAGAGASTEVRAASSAQPLGTLQPWHAVPLLFLHEWGVLWTVSAVAAALFFLFRYWKVIAWEYVAIFGLFVLPLVLLDHVLWTTWFGMATFGLFVGLAIFASKYRLLT